MRTSRTLVIALSAALTLSLSLVMGASPSSSAPAKVLAGPGRCC